MNGLTSGVSTCKLCRLTAASCLTPTGHYSNIQFLKGQTRFSWINQCWRRRQSSSRSPTNFSLSSSNWYDGKLKCRTFNGNGTIRLTHSRLSLIMPAKPETLDMVLPNLKSNNRMARRRELCGFFRFSFFSFSTAAIAEGAGV